MARRPSIAKLDIERALDALLARGVALSDAEVIVEPARVTIRPRELIANKIGDSDAKPRDWPAE